jgi:predicted metal-dependent phosphoesterase TrpH
VFADLHLHTHFSDGTYTPEELAAHARDKGLSAIALTDHDTVEGCPRAAAACERLSIEFISGTELTADYKGTELHILGYFLDLQNAVLLEEIAKCQLTRQNRVREMVDRLNRRQIPLRAERVFAIANCRSPGRPHVARALVEDGFCATMDEAFERFLKRSRPAWVPKRRISAADAIGLIHQAGGLAVMAHPGLNRTDTVIAPVVEAGLDGIECFHTKHSTAASERYLEMADRYKLLVTGGSDCHGMSKGRPLIGTLKLPYQHVELMKIAVARRRDARPSSACRSTEPLSSAPS